MHVYVSNKMWNKETINLKFSYAHFPIDDDADDISSLTHTFSLELILDCLLLPYTQSHHVFSSDFGYYFLSFEYPYTVRGRSLIT